MENTGDADSVGFPLLGTGLRCGDHHGKTRVRTGAEDLPAPDYYKGYCSMRESGFYISFRFGPYGAATHHDAPIRLNSLLYKSEKDLQAMAEILGRKTSLINMSTRPETRKDNLERLCTRQPVVLRLRLQPAGRAALKITQQPALSVVGRTGHPGAGAGTGPQPGHFRAPEDWP